MKIAIIALSIGFAFGAGASQALNDSPSSTSELAESQTRFHRARHCDDCQLRVQYAPGPGHRFVPMKRWICDAS